MANIRKCLRCKEVFATDDITEKYRTPTKIYAADYGTKRKYADRYDLCAKCSGEFFTWLFKKRNKKRNTID